LGGLTLGSMESFSDSYAEARGKFLAAACDAGARLTTHVLPDLKGPDGETLACDVAVLGPEQAERAAIIVSGTHGIETFGMSAIQHHWLTARAGTAQPQDIKIVLVHAINPWAFAYKTRANENNVDLNRNFLSGDEWQGQPNPAYDRLTPFFHSDPSDAARCFDTWLAYRAYLDQHGAHLENELFEGQTHRPDGLCYAGAKPEWSNRAFRRIIRDHLAAAKRIGFIDWHTGVGAFGQIVHLIFDPVQSAEYEAAARWWNLAPQEKSAYKAGSNPKFRGLLCQAIRQELPDALCAGGVIEFGTAEEYGMFRGDVLDVWLRNEGRNDPGHDHFRDDYRNTLCPRDLSWRRTILHLGPLQMNRLIDGVRSWDS
jgi:hypothetical protein